MENLFIKNSSQDQEVLATSKRFLDTIVSQIKDAYSNVRHCETRNHKNTTSIHIGCHPNRASTHCFSVDNKGIITYTSKNALFFKRDGVENSTVVKLLEKYPESKRYEKSSDFTLVVKIKNETDFVNKVKDIVFMMERDGFVLKR